MSMSEFDRQLNTWEGDLSTLSTQGHDLPADFSEEDIAFAQELDTLFAPHKEEIPPYFVQTLLESDDPRFQPVEHGFEYKTRARVLRRLKLTHRLFYFGRPSLHAMVSFVPLRRSLVAVATLMLFALMTVILTAPSFASGMAILLHGGKAGVLLTQYYPSNVKSAPRATILRSDPDTQPMMSLFDAQQSLHGWKMYMPQVVPDKYKLTDTYIYQEPQQSWADGPFMEFDFSLTGATPQGTGQLAVREFKLKNDSVFLVAKDGAAEGIRVDKQNGLAQAVYVDGQWVLHDKIFPVWVYGQRSELIYQKDGIVFWIVGDQRDGINKDVLLKVANSLQMMHVVSRLIPVGSQSNINTVNLLNGDINGPFTGDVLAVFPDGSGVGTYLSVAGSDETYTNQAPALHAN